MLFKQIWLKIHARNRCAEERSAIFMEWFFNVWTTLDYIGSVSSSATPRNVYGSLQHMAKSFSQWSPGPLYRPQHKAVIYQNKCPTLTRYPTLHPTLDLLLSLCYCSSRELFLPYFYVLGCKFREHKSAWVVYQAEAESVPLSSPWIPHVSVFSDTLSHIWALGKLTGMQLLFKDTLSVTFILSNKCEIWRTSTRKKRLDNL